MYHTIGLSLEIAFKNTYMRYILSASLLLTFTLLNINCRKLIEINDPVNTITTSQSFSNDANASSAVIGVYNTLAGPNNITFSNSGATLFAGMSADELILFYNDPEFSPFQNNNLEPTNNTLAYTFWTQTYFAIYQANAAIEGLSQSTGVSLDLRNQLLGECKFLRGFCYFYLTNLFGDVPLVLTTNWNENATLTRTKKDDIYKQIIADLIDADKILTSGYSYSSNERIRANKWAATALLARVYLFKEDWINAELLSSKVLSNTELFNISENLTNVFQKNSQEAILQFQVSDKSFPYATKEGNTFIPFDNTSNPNYYLTSQLLESFETGDLRKQNWIDSTIFNDGVTSTTYFYPFKYKIRFGTPENIEEYYTVLRLAEQYLIRAEARANQGNIPGAIADINVIRNRAQLAHLTSTLNQSETLKAIQHERQIELFAEFGHRWLDLKRLNQADVVLSNIKGGNWQTTDQLYPIPLTELQRNPQLIQNPGY
jgi:hypothetical protein